jgi:pimeloyl-ACP methyl ester carboxylesterase
VIPIAQAHAGWVAVELRRRLGPRVPQMIFTNWNPIFTDDNPLAPSFFDAMQALQDADGWRQTAEQLLMTWLSDAPASVGKQIRNEMGSHGFEDWARAGGEIAAVYAREGDPLQALGSFDPPVPALHVYGHPRSPEYLSAQESFAQDNPWFAVRRLTAVSHFPMLEAPDETAGAINDFILSTDEKSST